MLYNSGLEEETRIRPCALKRAALRLDVLTMILQTGSGHIRRLWFYVRDRDCERAVSRTQYAEAAEVSE
jgi:hypothetical protein